MYNFEWKMVDAVIASDVVARTYDVGHVIGTGAYSTCFRALDRAKEEDVVLKITNTSGRARALMCEREASVLRSIAHPNIVELYAWHAKVDRHDVTVLEFLRGPTLDSMIEAIGAVREPFVRSVAMDLCAALRHLHRHGVLHRDIKPDNVLLEGVAARDDDSEWPERAVLIDFGFARALSPADVDAEISLAAADGEIDHSLSSLTMDLSAVGAGDYAAPEVVTRAKPKNYPEALTACTSKYGMAAEAYSLGRVLRHALCGTLEDPNANPIGALCGGIYRRYTKSKKTIVRNMKKACSEVACDAVLGLTKRNPKARLKLKALETGPWLNHGKPPVVLPSPRGATTPSSPTNLLPCAMDLSTRQRTRQLSQSLEKPALARSASSSSWLPRTASIQECLEESPDAGARELDDAREIKTGDSPEPGPRGAP